VLNVVHATPASVPLCACCHQQGLCNAHPVWFWRLYVLAMFLLYKTIRLRCCFNKTYAARLTMRGCWWLAC
jgi:predicted cobalt transporter CbtA